MRKAFTLRGVVNSLCLCIFLLAHATNIASAQEAPAPQPLVNLGDAVVSGFSGILETGDLGATGNGNTDASNLFIDPDGASLRGFDLSNPGSVDAFGQAVAPEFLSITARDIGQVFGVALDDATDPTTGLPAPNIYVTATSAYGLAIVGPDADGDGIPERLASGAPEATWMEGLFAINKGGGPGSVWKIDGLTGEASLLANIIHDDQANSGAALGNIAFDAQHRQLLVSDRDTGLIHRLDLDGNELEKFDHGVTGQGVGGLEAVPFDTDNRADIGTNAFDPADPTTWGLADPGRRVWGLAVRDGRLFYAIADGPQIWSVGLNADGSFDAITTRWELDLTENRIDDPSAQFGGPGAVQDAELEEATLDIESHEIADIAFAGGGEMILAQRPPVSGDADFGELVWTDSARVLRYRLESPDDPDTASRWVEVPDEFAIGIEDEHRNATGGVALGYGYGPTGTIDRNTCEATLWATGDRLGDSPLELIESDADGLASGAQGTPADLIRPDNVPPDNAFVIDYDGQYPQTEESGHVGDIEVAYRCPPDVLVEVPGPPGAPVPTGPGPAPPPGPPPGVAPGPPAQQYADLAIAKRLTGACAQGQDCSFEIVVTNLGPADYKGPLLLVDSFSVPGVTLAGAAPAPWKCQQAGNQISCNRPTLLLRPGRSASLPLKLRYAGPPNIGSWQNCVALTWVGRGAADAQSIRALQTELAKLGYYKGAIDGIAGSGTRQAIRDLEKALGLPETGQITPTLLEWMFGAGASTVTDPNAANDIACVTVPTKPPDVSIKKPDPLPVDDFDLAVEKGPVNPAVTILNCSVDAPCKFRVTITNKGGLPYTGPITIKDKLLPGFTLTGWKGPSVCQQQGNVFSCVSAPQATLAPGKSETWDFELKLPPGSAPSKVEYFENCAEIDWKTGPGDTNKANDRGCTTIVVAPGPPHLQITKKKVAPKQCERGKDCVYTITVKNIGKTAHEGPISIEDRNFKAPGMKLTTYAPKPPWACKEISLGKYRCDHPARTLKPGDSLPELYVVVFIPKTLDEQISSLDNCAAITQGKGKIGPESCVQTPIKPLWDLSVHKTAHTKTCKLVNGKGECTYGIVVINSGTAPYEGPVKIVEDNVNAKKVTLKRFTHKPWDCKDGPAAGNITCIHPWVSLKPNTPLGGLNITVDLNDKVPDQSALFDCAKVFYKGNKPDANPNNDESCISTPLIRIQEIYGSGIYWVGIVGTKECVAPNCSYYQMSVRLDEGKYDGPLSLTIEAPAGSDFAPPRLIKSPPNCPASRWSCTKSGGLYSCRVPNCAIAPGEEILMGVEGKVAPELKEPPEIEETREICGILEWQKQSPAGSIEQAAGTQNKQACMTTRILARPKPRPPVACPKDEGWKPYPEGTALLPGWMLKKFGTGANAIFCMKQEELTDLQLSTAPFSPCQIGQTCRVETSLGNVGQRAFTEGIKLEGRVSPPVSIRAVTPASPSWQCRTVGGGRYRCSGRPAEFAPGGLAKFGMALAIPRNFRAKQLTHSVRLVWPLGKGDANPANDAAIVTIPIAAPSPPPQTAPPPPPPPSCTGDKVRVNNRCVCPRGTTEVRGGRCVQPQVAPPPPPAAPPRPSPSCTGGKVRAGNRCVCPRGTIEVRGGRCVWPQPAPPLPQQPALPPPPPRAPIICPRGTVDFFGTCVPIQNDPPALPPPPAAPPPATQTPPPLPPGFPMPQVIPQPMQVICPPGTQWHAQSGQCLGPIR